MAINFHGLLAAAIISTSVVFIIAQFTKLFKPLRHVDEGNQYISDFLVTTAKTIKQRSRLPDLDRLAWPQPEYSLVVTGANDSTKMSLEPKLSYNQRKTLENIFRIFINTMEELGFSDRWMLYGGTLLGAFRHHDIIPWDDDIDVLVDVAIQSELRTRFRNKSVAGALHFPSGKRDKVCASIINPPNNPKDLYGSRRLSSRSWGWPYLDISYFDDNGTHITELTTSHKRNYTYAKRDVYPLLFRPFNRLWVPTPRNSLGVLQETYPSSTSLCAGLSYLHTKETRASYKQIECSEVGQRFAFIERQSPMSINMGFRPALDNLVWVHERLVLRKPSGNVQLIHEVQLAAPYMEALTETYTLNLREKAKISNDIATK